jgi:hypothetical protein
VRRSCWAALVLAAVVAVGGCGGHDTETSVRRPVSAGPSVTPSYDASLPPVQAVLALVPHAATTLAFTDFDQVRAQFGGVTRGLWKRAAKQAPLLTSGMLRGTTGPVTQDDVAWEAHYSGGGTDGWVVAFHPGVDLSKVTDQLHGGTVAGQLVTSQTLPASDARWTDLRGLVGPEAEATYVERGCLPGDTGGQRLQPLSAYAVGFGAHLATAYLGPGRADLFTRLRLGDAIPSFTADFTGGAADPSSGRIGFTMTNAADAAQQALRHKLPFAVCAEADVP